LLTYIFTNLLLFIDCILFFRHIDYTCYTGIVDFRANRWEHDAA